MVLNLMGHENGEWVFFMVNGILMGYEWNSWVDGILISFQDNEMLMDNGILMGY